jgi:flagellar motor switch protein FliM
MAGGNPTIDKPGSGLALLAGGSGGSAAAKEQRLTEFFAAAGTAFSATLGGKAEPPFTLALTGVASGSAGEVLNAHAQSVVSAAIGVAEWGVELLAGADRRFVLSLIDSVCGGSGAAPAFDGERALTKIEMEIAGWMFARLANSLQAVFAPAGEAAFVPGRTDCPPAYDCIGRPSTVIAAATFVSPGGGRMFVALPQSAFVFLRAPVPADVPHRGPAPDSAWVRKFGNRLGQADVVMRAVLGPMELTLGEVAGFRPQQVVPLDGLAANLVRLECNGEPLYWCTLGQAKGAYTLSIDTAIDREQEVMDDILSH